MSKRLVITAPALTVLLVLTACSSGNSPTASVSASGATSSQSAEASTPPDQGGELIVGIWGGVWEQAITELIPDFESETGSTVVLDISSSTDRVAKLQAAGDKAPMDIAFLTPEAMAIASKNELVGTFDQADIPNLAVTDERLLSHFKTDDGSYYAVPVSWGAVGILWRDDLVPFEITKFADLWNPALEGKIAIQNMPTLGAASFLIHAAVINGGSQQNLEPGWTAMVELRPNVQQFYSVSSDALAALVNGDVWVVETFAGQGVPLADKHVTVTLPADGVTFSIQSAGITASAPNPTLAAKFLDYMMRPEVQAKWVELTRAAPGGVDVEIPDEIAAQMPETPETLPNLLNIDFLDMGLHMQEWSERWLREVAR